MNINEIRSAEWGISLNEIGGVVEGNDDINQCIGIIVRTIKGTDPFRPNFGCDVLRYLDLTKRRAAPGLAKEIGDAVTLWEQRIDVKRVSYQIEETKILFSVDWHLKGAEGLRNNASISLNLQQNDNGSVGPVKPQLPSYILSTETYEVLTTEDGEIFTI